MLHGYANFGYYFKALKLLQNRNHEIQKAREDKVQNECSAKNVIPNSSHEFGFCFHFSSVLQHTWVSQSKCSYT